MSYHVKISMHKRYSGDIYSITESTEDYCHLYVIISSELLIIIAISFISIIIIIELIQEISLRLQ